VGLEIQKPLKGTLFFARDQNERSDVQEVLNETPQAVLKRPERLLGALPLALWASVAHCAPLFHPLNLLHAPACLAQAHAIQRDGRTEEFALNLGTKK